MRTYLCRVSLAVASLCLAAAQTTIDLPNFSYRPVFDQASAVTTFATASRTGTPCQIRVTGGDSHPPQFAFVFAWGDGYFTSGFFPQTHNYTDCSKNFVVEVRPDYGSGPQTGAATLARLQNLTLTRVQDVSTTPVVAANAVPPFTSRLTAVPTFFQPLTNGQMTEIAPEDFAYVVALGSKIINELINGNRYPSGGPFQQVALTDPNAANTSVAGYWYLDPLAMLLGTSGGTASLEWSAYLREAGRNFAMNMPSAYYYGGRVDGAASSIYNETVAQILAHAAGQELVRNYAAYGLTEDVAKDLALSLTQSMNVLRGSADAYLTAGRPFNTWNNPGTSADETAGTVATLAYVFMREAETRGLGYTLPVKRMMEFLQRFSADWALRYAKDANTADASAFRSTLMVTAISHGLQVDLRGAFQALNFTVDSTIYGQLTGQTSPGIQVTPTSATAPGAGGTGSSAVTAPADVTWTAFSNATWLVVESGTAGRGAGQVQWRASANTGSAARSATIQVGTQFITVTQNAGVPSYRFIPVTPCRVADTRVGEGKTGLFGPPFLPAGGTREIPVPAGGCGVPSTAKAYSLNFTVLPKTALAYMTVWPTGQPQPVVSTLNSFHGGVVANAAIVPAGTGGSIHVFVTHESEVIADINGYFDDVTSANAYDFFPVTPCRAVDTRLASGFTGLFGPPWLVGGAARDIPLTASGCNIAASAKAYSLNATVVPPGPLSYLTLWPSGVAQPVVSTLNSFEGVIVANAALVPAGNGSAISAFATHNTDLILDVNGYFGPPSTGSLRFYTVTPCRVADTRDDGGAPIDGVTTRAFAVAGKCGIPSTAQAYSLNVTVVPTGPLAYLTLWPTGAAQPVVSTLNSFQGRVLANAALVPAGANGSVSVFVTNPTHVILDINGYFAP